MSDSVEVLLGRLDERISEIQRRMRDDDKKDREFQEWKTKIETSISLMAKSLSDSEPTIQEFITIKHQVAGAGKLGKYLWTGLGLILGFIISVKTELFRFFQG